MSHKEIVEFTEWLYCFYDKSGPYTYKSKSDGLEHGISYLIKLHKGVKKPGPKFEKLRDFLQTVPPGPMDKI